MNLKIIANIENIARQKAAPGKIWKLNPYIPRKVGSSIIIPTP